MKVDVRVKTFINILMVVLALLTGMPQAACIGGTPDAVRNCCCTGEPVCKCQPEKPCLPACARAQDQASDMQAPARAARGLFASDHGLLFPIAPTKIRYFVLNPAVRRPDSNAAPPGSGAPPQALLCLWRV